MKKIKIVTIFLILSSGIFASGEISFRKQREKELKEEQAQEQNIKQESVTKKVKPSSKEKLIRQEILNTAFSQMGVKYIYGANGNGAYDCSSYVQYVYKKSLRIDLPRVSAQQAESGRKVKINQLKAGDLVTFDTLKKGYTSHIGIYIGNNEFIHASSGYKKVVVSKLEGYYAEKFLFGVKII